MSDPNARSPKDENAARALGAAEETPEERYLWDPSAPPDAQVRALEEQLASLRPMPAFDARTLPQRPLVRRSRVLAVGAAGVLALAAALALVWLRRAPLPVTTITPDPPTPSLSAPAPVAGAGPAFAWKALEGQGSGLLRAGGWIETDASTKIRLDIADIGHVDLDPGSKLGLLASSASGHRLSLAKGRLAAKVVAVPRLFIIETKRATAVDLGCAYELAVDESGAGSLRVTSGAVELEGGRDRVLPVLVPKGAECAIDREQGPRTPVWSRLSPEAKAAVAAFDASPTALAALDRALALLGERDSLTLLHLLEIAPAARRATILDRLLAIRALPPGVARGDLLAGSKTALLAYREAVAPRWYRPAPGEGVWSPDEPGKKPAP
jgi:ferric-dicitrate binding protein FerR (iron transport regulator)